jgi:hypothetical protein
VRWAFLVTNIAQALSSAFVRIARDPTGANSEPDLSFLTLICLSLGSGLRERMARRLLGFEEGLPEARIVVDCSLNTIMQKLRQGADLIQAPRLRRP